MYRTEFNSAEGPDCFGALAESLRPWNDDAAPSAAGCRTTGCLARSSTSKLSKGTFLDPTIVLRGSAGASLVAAVTEKFAAYRELRRKRQVREVENEQQLLCCMLANGLRCLWYRTTPLVAYQRKVDAEYYAGLNRPKWLSAQALGRAVALLTDSGLVEHQVGERGTSSAYCVTDKLLTLAEGCDISERSLGTSLHRDDLVQLKGPKPRPTFDHFTRTLIRQRADRIYFEPTSESEQWCEGLTAFNDFVAAQDIAVDPPDGVLRRWVSNLNDDDLHIGAKLYRPELFRDAVYRVFNDGTADSPAFNRGGRLFGAWWINAPEEVRGHIRINGEPTVELDYAACHPRMLYHELGLEPPADPYDIAEVQEFERRDGCAAGAYRPFVKWLTQILINGRGRPDLVSAPPEMARPQDVTLGDITTYIERRHKAISSAFRSGAGLRLMKTESEIAFAVVTEAKQSGWLALPVHDSFVIQVSRADELKKIMNDEYEARLKFKPFITIKDR